MTEDELKTLKDYPAPPPRTEARAAALAAATATFDAAGASLAKNSDAHAQGNERGLRHMHASENTRRRKMRAPMLYKIAAGIAVILVATPVAVYFFEADYAARLSAPGGIVHNERLPLGQAAPEAPADEPQPDQSSPTSGKLVYDRVAEGQAEDSDAPAPEPVAKQDSGPSQERIQYTFPDTKHADASPARPAPPPPANIARAEQKPAPSIAGEDAGKPAAKSKTRIGAIYTPPNATAPSAAPPPIASQGPMVFEKGVFPPNAQRMTGGAVPMSSDDQRIAQESKEHRDRFETPAPNPVKQVATEPVSTFSADVDTASYAFVRRALNAGRLPAKDAVRVEEMINYFPYTYPRPETAETPFQPTVTVTPAPWKPTNKLVHIGIKGYDIVPAERPRANLVFLIDISGSMQPPDRLPLVKNAFRLMLDELKPDDTVGIVTYASGSGVALEPTPVAEKGKILDAIDALGAGGSTAGAAGINDAYRLAEAHFDKAGVNRIILATDGDFNVGISDAGALKGYIERKRDSGIFLSILGVGQDNYNDALMQKLAQNGNGIAAYADTLNEARKVLVDEASSTLFTIARDVKIQMEFNPATVSEYRLIGYETRALAREDFNNDKVDAGDIGSGHTVTAIYEVTPVGAPKLVDDLRYGQPAPAVSAQAGELGFLKLRYKLPKEDTSRLISMAVGPALEKPDIADAPEDVRFSVAVAAFGQILRGLPYLQSYGYDNVLALAQGARGADPFGYRSEFLNLVRLAKSARP